MLWQYYASDHVLADSTPAFHWPSYIPCLDEEDGVALVVKEYVESFPAARIVVVDNGSRDRTAERARAAGAEVVAKNPTRRGKVRAIVTAFGLLDEELVIMVDGDGS